MTSYFLKISKQYLKSKILYIAIFSSLFILIGLGWALPAGIIVPSSITFSIIIIVMILFGGNLIEIRKTSLIKSLSLTKISKLKYFLINILVTIIFCFGIVTIIFFFTWIFLEIDFLASDLSAFNRPLIEADIVWSEIKWFSLIYGLFLTFAVTFSITFLIISFTKTSYSVYLFVFVYCFMLLSIGDILIPRIIYKNSGYVFFDVSNYLFPHFYTNKIIAGSIATTQNLPSFIANNEDSIKNDIDALQAWVSAGFPTTNGLLTLIDWSSVPDYNNYVFELNFLNNEILQNQIVKWTIDGNENTFSYFINSVEMLLSFDDTYQLWDFDSLNSMLICFFPWILIAFFSPIAIRNFKWSVR